MKREKLKKWGLLGFSLLLFGVMLGLYFWENRGLEVALERVGTEAVKFSKQSGVYRESIEIFLSSDFELPVGTKIYYTLDGDNPSRESNEYNNGISLALDEEKTMVYPVKAIACYEEKCSNRYERTYIISKTYGEAGDLDIISLTSSKRNLYDYNVGILVPGKTYDTTNGEKGNYSNRGDDYWMRDSEAAFFDTAGNVLWEKKLGLAVTGGVSRSMDVKSFRLVANEKYGYDGIDMEFYEPGDSARFSLVSHYNSLRLRSGAQDISHGNIKAGIASRLAEESGFDGYFATKRVSVYLNGDFYGIFDIEQNFSNSFLVKKYSLASGDEIEDTKGTEKQVLARKKLDTIMSKDLNVEENRKALEREVDIDNMLTYYALNILWNNTDWPQNNVEIWRYTGNPIEGNEYSDGRWRFLIFDVDLMYHGDSYENVEWASQNVLDTIMENKYRGANSQFRNILQSEVYRERFLEILAELKEEVFKTENILKIVDEEADKISKVAKESGQIYYNNYDDKIMELKESVRKTNKQINADIKKYFGIDLDSVQIRKKEMAKLSGLKISEISAKSKTDWIKITNFGNDAIDLGNYYISDNQKELNKYQLPYVMLEPEESIIINGKKNYYAIGDYICNFNLSEGEVLYLSQGGDVIDALKVPRMDKYETYGRYSGTEELRFFYNRNEERKVI